MTNLAEQLQSLQLADILADAERLALAEVSMLIQAGLPSATEELKPTQSKNLQLQLTLTELEGRLYFLMQTYASRRMQYEGQLVSSGEYDDYPRSKLDSCLMAMDSQYFDMTNTLHQLTALHKYVGKLIWLLKAMQDKMQ